MNRKKIFIVGILVFLILSGLLTVFVFKARGSNEMGAVSGCVPYNVSVSKSGDYRAVIEWYTTEECLGYITYGNDREKLDAIAVDNDSLSSKKHQIVIDKLLPSQDYFYVINSGKIGYGNSGVPLSFSLSSL